MKTIINISSKLLNIWIYLYLSIEHWRVQNTDCLVNKLVWNGAQYLASHTGSMSLHSVLVVGRYQETGQDRCFVFWSEQIIRTIFICRAMLGAVWENEIKVDMSDMWMWGLKAGLISQSLTGTTDTDPSSITGLHFIYPGLLLFYVEGHEEDINDFIRLLNNLTAKEALGLTKVKVVHIINNMKVRNRLLSINKVPPRLKRNVAWTDQSRELL